MRLHQVGDDRRWVEATERGVGVGGVMLLQHQGVFAFRRFKVSDLVHTFGEFVGILSILKKFIGKFHCSNCSYQFWDRQYSNNSPKLCTDRSLTFNSRSVKTPWCVWEGDTKLPHPPPHGEANKIETAQHHVYWTGFFFLKKKDNIKVYPCNEIFQLFTECPCLKRETRERSDQVVEGVGVWYHPPTHIMEFLHFGN